MNTRFFSLATALLTTAGLVACSSDSSTPADAGPVGTPGTVNVQAAKSSSTTLVTGLSQAVEGNNGQGSVGVLMQGAQQAQGIVSPSAGAGATKPASLGLLDLGDAIGQVSQAITDCQGACSGTSCDFKGCGTDTPQNSVVITGQFSWTGGNVKCVGLTYDIETKGAAGSGTKVKLTLDCDVTSTSSTLKGFIKSTGKSSIQNAALAEAGVGNVDVTWTSDTTFNDVKYTSGKATSGSVKVVASSTYAGQTYTGTADVTFP